MDFKRTTLLRTHHGFLHTHTILWVARNEYDKLNPFGIGKCAYMDEFVCKNYVATLLDGQPTAQTWLKNNFCPVLASLPLKSSVPSHETCKNLEATQISLHSSTRTIHRLLTPAALKQPYPRPHSTQKSPLPIKTTYSTGETPSECRPFHADDRLRSINQSQQLMLERFSGCVCPIRNKKRCPNCRHVWSLPFP